MRPGESSHPRSPDAPKDVRSGKKEKNETDQTVWAARKKALQPSAGCRSAKRHPRYSVVAANEGIPPCAGLQKQSRPPRKRGRIAARRPQIGDRGAMTEPLWSRRRESNPHSRLGKPVFYR